MYILFIRLYGVLLSVLRSESYISACDTYYELKRSDSQGILFIRVPGYKGKI